MQVDHSINLISPKSFFGVETLDELADLTEEYPYFQIVHVLYALSLKENNDESYYSELRKASCYSGDRNQLFHRVDEGFLLLEENDEDVQEDDALTNSFELIDFYLSTNENEQENSSGENALEAVLTSTNVLSTDYLAYNQKEELEQLREEQINQEQEEQELVEIAEEIIEEEEVTEEAVVSPLLRYQDKIDKFLEEDKKAPIKITLKEESEDLYEIAEELFDDSNKEISVSENLARNYIRQKKYDKALEIIHKLSLLYPEKNRYFADQIRFLEKVIINTKK